MKKILIIQENGRHDANRKFRECFSLQRAFEFYGWKALVWGLGHSNYKDNINFNDFDLILNLENYDESNWCPNLSNVNKPLKLLWSIDAHCRGFEIYEKNYSDNNYDYLLHSTKDFVIHNYHIWFPNAYDEELIFPLEIPKTHEVGFCGNFVNRGPLLNYLKDNFNLKLDIFVIGDEMVKAINSYKFHFNKNISNDINYRSFETLGCGSVLITNFNSNYEELGFENNVNCLIYKNDEELKEILSKKIYELDYTLLRDNSLKLSKFHTYKSRVNELICLFGL